MFMGSVKTSAVKNLAEELILNHGDKFSDNFETNKKVLEQVRPIKSKKIKNSLAGYIATRMQQIKRTGI